MRQKPVDASARVVADLEHRIDAVLSQIEISPRLEPRSLGQRVRRDVHGVPTVVVQHDQLRRTACEKALACGKDVGLEPRLPRFPVRRQAPPDLAHAADL
jgi:hypothetical protein